MAKPGKTKLCILFGGRSGEHEISLKSAASVISALDPADFEISAIGITPQGRFADTDEVRRMLPAHLSSRVLLSGARGASRRRAAALPEILNDPGDGAQTDTVFFPLLHGPYGEDGTIQGLLEIANVPYIGSGVLASSVGMDKDVMKRIFVQGGLPVVPFRVLYADEFRENPEKWRRKVSRELGYPMFSKPANLGSSVGIRKIHSEREFVESVEHAALFDSKIVIEKGLKARELECAVLGNRYPKASVVGEIIPAHEFYDYDAKYISPDSQLVIPARVDSSKSRKVQALALEAFRLIEGSGLSRVDFFLETKTGKIWVNEINTMPGFTPISMFAKLWSATGVPFSDLVQTLVELALERYEERNKRMISTV